MIINADLLSWCASYDGPLFHAALLDPPYHLTEIVKRFGGEHAAPAQFGTDGAFQRASKGFMGKQWDGGDIAFRPETWALIARVLHPGAFGMAFASSRGWHRMAVAIEDAGLIIHPVILCWSYSTGFPKATRIDTQIDRRAGVERTKVGTKKHQPKFAAAELGYREKDNGYNSKDRESFDITAPATDLAQAWQGHRYGMQAMKPALEPIIVFQKPYDGRAVDSITATGAGALWIDGGRIAGDPWEAHDATGLASVKFFTEGSAPVIHKEPHTAGRWPANLILSHHPDCKPAGTRRVRGTKGDADYSHTGVQGSVPITTNVKTGRHYADPDGYETIAAWRCVEGCPVRRLGEQSGELHGAGSAQPPQDKWDSDKTPGWGNIGTGPSGARYGDVGTAARFFFQVDYLLDRLEDADPVAYFAKSSRSEREAGLDPRQVALIESGAFDEATINDGRQKSIDNPYQRGETTRRNIHPTLKPLSLCRYLATLLLPPALYAPRRLFVPFAGAGSEMIGADLAGWEEVVGVELVAEYCRIAEARLAYWRQRRHEFLDPSKPITATLAERPDGQLDLFDEVSS